MYENCMKKFLPITLLFASLLLGAGCNSIAEKPVPTVETTTSSTSANTRSTHDTASTAGAYSVDEFVTNGFKQEGNVRILVESVTCYNNTCSLDGKKAWLRLSKEESRPFLLLPRKDTPFMIEAEADCSKEVNQCNEIKKVRVVTDTSS